MQEEKGWSEIAGESQRLPEPSAAGANTNRKGAEESARKAQAALVATLRESGMTCQARAIEKASSWSEAERTTREAELKPQHSMEHHLMTFRESMTLPGERGTPWPSCRPSA